MAADNDTGPSGQVPETVVARLRPHVRALFWPTVALLVAVVAGAYFTGQFDELWLNLVIPLGAGIVVIVAWLIPLFAWLGRNYTITTRRIVLRSGFVVRVRQELLHSRGYDVTVRKGALQSLFGSGDVIINSGLDRPVVLRDVPDADLVQEALHDLMERNLTQVSSRRQREQSAGDDETTMWGRR